MSIVLPCPACQAIADRYGITGNTIASGNPGFPFEVLEHVEDSDRVIFKRPDIFMCKHGHTYQLKLVRLPDHDTTTGKPRKRIFK